VDVSSLTILASLLGVGIGFGLQNITSNFVSGIIILLERPIKVGDFINVGDLVGTVERIGARSTEIRTPDQVSIIIPNADFVNARVVNWSHGHPVSRLRVPFGVAYGSDVNRVQQVVLQAAKSHADVLGYPKPHVWFSGFGDNSLDFELLVWINDPRSQFQLKSDLYYLLEASLRRHRIEIPFPQRDLHLRSPLMDQALQLWIQQQGGQPKLDDATGLPTDMQTTPHDDLPPLEEVYINHTTSIKQRSRLTEVDMNALITAMRGEDGVEIGDRRYRLNLYSRCFVGSEAVEWLMKTQKATREEAIRIGQMLIDCGIIHHVVDEHPFLDDYLFYRFYVDEPEQVEGTSFITPSE
jgi:hypothetical protein